MKTQRLLVVLTAINLALLVFLLAQTRLLHRPAGCARLDQYR
jgi:hypothetical protein